MKALSPQRAVGRAQEPRTITYGAFQMVITGPGSAWRVAHHGTQDWAGDAAPPDVVLRRDAPSSLM
jgi:hypothetical protein